MGITRIVASIGASFEDMIGKMENHEAVAEMAIAKVQQAAAKLHTQAQQIARRREHQQRQQSHLITQSQAWRRRACRLGTQDQPKALRCLQAMKKCERELAHVNQQIEQSDHLLADIESHLRDTEAHLQQLMFRKANLSARACRSKAANTCNDALGAGGADALFERWEQAVCADEYGHFSLPSSPDSLERELRESEDHEQLQAELELLIAQSAEQDR